ncbi:MAG: PhoX family protein, partial [Actinomycetota bacterium]|nr:PhoX family protein [Actinomycetota bacterium]
ISVNDKVGSFSFETIPDGLAVSNQGKNVHVYVNHETSLVPFPAGISDFTNSLVSKLVIERTSQNILRASYVIPSEANYQRFCSNFLVGKPHGFSRQLLLTSEEATDMVNRTGEAFPARAGAEQAGVVVAYDIRNDVYKPVYSMGRHNHENAVAIPGYKVSVILSGDDTFSAPSSQMYMYLTKGVNGILNDAGALYGFKSDDAAVNDYGDLSLTKSTSGTFIRVPVSVALGDQTALESWSNQNNVFQFIRIEDIAYDRTTPNVVYFADTGEPRALPDATTTRLRRGPSGTAGPYPNGRLFRMELDKTNPLKVTSLSVLVDGDSKGAAGAKDLTLVHNPDNIETTKKAILIQEDPGSQNSYAASDPNGTTARIWKYDLATKALTVVARVNQKSLDPAAAQGNWESSGIVDASYAFGPGWFYSTVQAHSVLVQQERRGTTTFKREHGQLLLIKIPGT